MALILNEEQQMLKDAAKEFLAANAPIEQFRTLRDNDYEAFDADLWPAIVEMGWTALTLPEEYNGLDFGFVGLGQVLEEMGRNLTKAPLLSSIAISGSALINSTNAELKATWIPEIMNGTKRLAYAQDEQNYFDPSAIATTATSTPSGYEINGSKKMIIDGKGADAYVVVAKTDEGENALFLVEANTAGLSSSTDVLLDAGTYCSLNFNKVMVANNQRISEPGKGAALINLINNTAAICLAAEMLGMTKEAFEQTIAYLKERTQFGKRIGSYQALQHRAAKMFCEIELCKSVVIKALQGLDQKAENLDELASLAKAKLGRTLKLVSNEAMQMHGGIGVTDDVNIGFYFKRARVAQRLFGDYNYHLDRYAQLNQY
ncbi:MAG: acyl-CoA dehydrogenase family protein [Flavobacteriaceae bacterium]